MPCCRSAGRVSQTGRPLAHRVIQTSARPRIALGCQVWAIRRILSNYQRYLVWCIELFFKWIKQQLRIKQFYGTRDVRTVCMTLAYAG
jgi:hypothetical protein